MTPAAPSTLLATATIHERSATVHRAAVAYAEHVLARSPGRGRDDDALLDAIVHEQVVLNASADEKAWWRTQGLLRGLTMPEDAHALPR